MWRVGVCMLARCARAKSHALSPHTSRDAPCGVCLGVWRVVFGKLLLGPPHYHDTFQPCQTWRVGVCMLAKCARAKSHALSPHTSRDAPCGVCLGVWRVVFWPSWCLVHHTTMAPFKHARRGEWAY